MVLNDLLHHREAESGSVCFATAHEWFKQLAAYLRRDASSVIFEADLQALLGHLPNVDLDAPGVARHGIKGIEQQILKSALQPSKIEPACTSAVGMYRK